MGILDLFKKKKVEDNIQQEQEGNFEVPEEDCRWECKGCGLGIDPSFHKYTKQNGFYFHKLCWKKAVRLTKQNNLM